MPESKSRNTKPAYTPPPTAKSNPAKLGNPGWLVPTMVTMFLIGLLWIVVFYLTSGGTSPHIPVMKNLNNIENILVGFGFIGVGFGLATRWH